MKCIHRPIPLELGREVDNVNIASSGTMAMAGVAALAGEDRELLADTKRKTDGTARYRDNDNDTARDDGYDDGYDEYDPETLTSPSSSSSFRRQRWSHRDSVILCVASVVITLGLVTMMVGSKDGWKLFSIRTVGQTHPKEETLSDFGGDSSTSGTFLFPPEARREEGRVVYAGVAPPGWDLSIPRQSDGPTNINSHNGDKDGVGNSGAADTDVYHTLMDPTVAVPDPYGWMRDESRSNNEVLDYLRAENEYTEALTRPVASLSRTLYEEMVSLTEETSHSFPFLRKGYFYYRRTVQNQSYPLHCRAPKPTTDGTISTGEYLQTQLKLWDGSATMPILPNEVVYLDENELAPGHDYFEIGSLEVSPSQDYVAYTVDTTGNELYNVVIQRIDDGKIVVDTTSTLVISDDIVWGATDDTLFYTKPDDSQRTYQVCRWQWRENDATVGNGNGIPNEELIFEEDDVLYWVGIEKSKDGRYLLILTDSSEASEVRYLDLTDPSAKLMVISERKRNVLYDADHYNGTWWLLSTTDGGPPDFQLWTVQVGSNNDWARVMDPQTGQPFLDGIPIESLDIVDGFIVVEGRENGLMQLWVAQIDDESNVVASERLEWGATAEPAHFVQLAVNEEFHTTHVVAQYESLITPMRFVQVDLRRQSEEFRTVLMEVPVPGYDATLYECDRIHVPSRDGTTRIPVSLVYRRSTMDKILNAGDDVRVPVHLYAYGAYGNSVEDAFASSRVPLLDRGMIYAIAHVRGGGENGRPWYEDGKFLNKKHTFEDFVDVARYLIDDLRWTTSDQLSIEGRSAGGLTIGASLNEAPELFRVAILGVPFVDVVATMIDASIPLTSGEWEEWGNPNVKVYFDYMMQYSPVNNVQSGVRYPSCLLLAGLFDPRVQYWEPAKFTASLRYGSTNYKDIHINNSSSNGHGEVDRPICLKTDMTSGHFSASDRYKYMESQAFDYAFVLWQLGLTDPRR